MSLHSQHGEVSNLPSTREPIFVVGSGRSGTTLLYHILLTSGDFPTYMAESKVLECPGHYGSLQSDRNRTRFLRDFTKSRQFARSDLDQKRFLEEAHHCTSYLDFLRYFMDRVAITQDKDRWVEKTPLHAYHIGKLAEFFPASKFVHVVRDGRDVALSLRRLGWTPSCLGHETLQLVAAAKRWEDVVVAADEAGRRNSPRYLLVHFEKLLCDGASVLERLSDFCSVRLDPKTVSESDLGALGNANTAFDSDRGAKKEDPTHRWKRQMTDRELSAIDAAVGKTLARFGYDRSRASAGWISRNSYAMSGEYLSLVRAAKNVVRTRTPVGRFVGSPLEIGKT